MAIRTRTNVIRGRQGDDLMRGIQSLTQGLQQFTQGRQRAKDFQDISNLTNQLTQGQQGPVQPGQPPLPSGFSPIQKRDEYMRLLDKLQSDQAISKVTSTIELLNQGIVADSRVSSNKVPGDLTQKAILTRPDGTQVKVNAKTSQIQANPNLDFVESLEFDASDFTIGTDKKTGRPIRTNKVTNVTEFTDFDDTPSSTPTAISQNVGTIQNGQPTTLAQDFESIKQRVAETGGNLTVDEIKLSSGVMSNVRQGYANILGSFISGEQAKDTTSARTQLDLFNKSLTEALSLNPRFPIAEQNKINKIITSPTKFFTDSFAALRNMKDTIAFFEGKNVIDNALLQKGGLTIEKQKQLSDNISTRFSILLMAPSQRELDFALEPIKDRDIESFDEAQMKDVLSFMRENPKLLETLPSSIGARLSRRKQTLGF